MMKSRFAKLTSCILLQAVFFLSGCGEQPSGSPVAAKSKEMSKAPEVARTVSAIPLEAESIRPEKRESAPAKTVVPGSDEEKPSPEEKADDIDWGAEITLDEMIAMAKSGKIREIQWHVMPNILRAETTDHRIFHLRNENKSVDLRNTLISAGIRVGKGGIIFRHVF
jgi:hypothetical protein